MSSDVDTQKRNLRPFTRRGSATADGNIGGTTVVSLWDPAVPEGLNEADDYWNDGQILILTGEMADEVREIVDWVQATGTLTVAPRFVNPNVSLLSADVVATDVIIPVVDASVFSLGAAYIWDDAPNAEEVTITDIDTVANELTIAAPGLVNAYTVLNNAAISMSPTILDGVEFTLMPPTRTVDTGEHTNPRRYEKDYGFVTLPVARAGGVATAVWDVGVACIRNPSGVPADGRTAGGITTVYTIELENPDAAAQTAWLEDGAGVVLSVIYHLAPTDTPIIDYPAGKTFGDVDLFINASIDGIVCQISGTEV